MKNHFKNVGILAAGAAVGTIVTKITEDRKKEHLTRAEAEEQICAKMYTIPPEEVLQVLEDLTDEGVVKLLEVLNNYTVERKSKENKCTCDDVSPPEEAPQVVSNCTDEEILEILGVLNNCTNECKNRKKECACDDGAILEDKKNER